MSDRLTRTTTIYDKRETGWRYLRTEETLLLSVPFGKEGGIASLSGLLVPKSNHSCGPQCIRRRKKAS